MPAPLLEVRHLRVEFPTRRGTLLALDDVSFDIAPGEILGVVGESGAGKSLTGAAIIGLLEPPGRVAAAILTEATLSFLGVGVPPTSPSLGTLIRVGNDFLFSGEWWITIFPGAMLVLIALSVNLLGDWLRDALNPRLR